MTALNIEILSIGFQKLQITIEWRGKGFVSENLCFLSKWYVKGPFAYLYTPRSSYRNSAMQHFLTHSSILILDANFLNFDRTYSLSGLI